MSSDLEVVLAAYDDRRRRRQGVLGLSSIAFADDREAGTWKPCMETETCGEVRRCPTCGRDH